MEHDGLDPTHECEWKQEALRLRAELAEMHDLRAQFDALKAAMEAIERRTFGTKSEKMPPPGKVLRKEESAADAAARQLAALQKRRERAALRQNLREQTVVHHLTADDRACPQCGGEADRPLGDGKQTTMYDYVPGYFVRQRHMQEKAACKCGSHIASAPPPDKPFERSPYGPGFVAHVVVMRCADSIPHYRLAKQYERIGIPMARSTINDLFHAAAEKLAPLSQHLIWRVSRSVIVQADETPMKMQCPNKRGYIWTFLGEGDLIAYRFSASRSGDTPADVLGGTTGALVVDGYTGYNRVTDVDGRARAGCLAHVRRKFFDAKENAPEGARIAMELILGVYRVEHEAKARNIVRTPEHLALRQSRSKEAMNALHAWLIESADAYPPKSAIGVAIGYALNQWETLVRFLDDVRIPVDNNASERALRVVALGRKNSLFVYDEPCGQNLAGLYSLVATCEAHDKDPIEYLKDVLLRIDHHPASRIDDLMPDRWQPPPRWIEVSGSDPLP